LGAFLGQPLQLKARKELFILAPCAGIFVLSPKLGFLPRNLASTRAPALDLLRKCGVGQDTLPVGIQLVVGLPIQSSKDSHM